MNKELKKRRRKWKIKNLGYLGFLLSLLKRKKVIVINEMEKTNATKMEIEPIEGWKPFMLVKPSGYFKIDLIRKLLRKKGIYIQRQYEIYDYNKALSFLFPSVQMKEKYYWKQINRQFYCDKGICHAYVLEFDKNCPIGLLEETKRLIRRKCGIDFYYVKDNDCPVYETSITPVHVPDLENMKEEYTQVMHFCK